MNGHIDIEEQKGLWRQGTDLVSGLLWPLALLLITSAFLLFVGCQRYELERYYDGSADVHLTYDWLTHYGELPEGMTFMYARDGDTISYYDPTHRVTENTLRLPSGEYRLTVMNKTFGEYSTMQFLRRNSHDGIYAMANTYSITADNTWDKGRLYMEEPERIGVATDTFTVPHTIDDLQFYDYREQAKADTLHLERGLTIWPMTTTLYIRVKVRGISYMRSLEGYITGLADGFYLNQAWRRTQVGTIRLDHWERESPQATAARRAAADGSGVTPEDNVGWMVTNVETFGLPHGRELLQWRTPGSNYILLHFTLINGRTVEFAYQVGLNIRYHGDTGTLQDFTRKDVTLELDLEIDAPFFADDEVPLMPYAQPEGSGQFDAEVAPWGEDVDVDVPVF